ncbi:hypothetical protein L596_021110 [Steinernema carpocapsae]|uniref:Muscleblind-like protein n=1 Tax=Steinernema carpocapsae TaxID=34508 RepID=A0A4U5MVR4_STECR|nr:hypothetical protein L596_021110 [Steinernema carpocapsae]
MVLNTRAHRCSSPGQRRNPRSSPVNPGANASITQLFTAKDPRWLQLEVCREFQRGQCSRSNLECKYAHPPPHVDVQNGRVTACYDSIKGRCTRENPKCKYLHPPQHLKDQLLINGRQSLALKTLLCSQLSQQAQQAQTHPALAPVNLAQLVHPQQQLVQMPYQYYPGGLAAIYPTMMQAPPTADPYQVQTPLQVAQMAALLQQQQHLAAAGLQTGLQAASPMAFAAAAYQQQQAAAIAAATAAAANASGHHNGTASTVGTPTAATVSRKRPHGDGDVTPSTSTAAEAAAAAAVAAANPLLLAAAVANGGVPCKRPAMDKNGASTQAAAVNAANLAIYSQQQQFNPYLMPSLHGYVPAVSS